MNVQDLEEHVIDVVRAAGRVEEIYPDMDNPGIVRIEADGKGYVLAIAEDLDKEPFAET